MKYLRVCANPKCKAEKYVNCIVRDGQLCMECSNDKFRPLNNGVPLTHICSICGKNPTEVNFYKNVTDGKVRSQCNVCVNEPKKGKKILTKKNKQEISDGFREFFERNK